ncbi:hypothetical protein BC628DRAFT_811275 [Trametes gibbosa]|nr:hypothetical protein BC628DRAFT_811275 [Trametes gibbosa]
MMCVAIRHFPTVECSARDFLTRSCGMPRRSMALRDSAYAGTACEYVPISTRSAVASEPMDRVQFLRCPEHAACGMKAVSEERYGHNPVTVRAAVAHARHTPDRELLWHVTMTVTLTPQLGAGWSYELAAHTHAGEPHLCRTIAPERILLPLPMQSGMGRHQSIV